MFYLAADSTTESTSTCSENFNVAACPSDEGEPETEWTTTQTESSSEFVIFAEIIEMPGKEVVLVIQDQIYPGTQEKNGYVFEWNNFGDTLNESSHSSGYTMVTQQLESSTTTLQLDFEGPDLVGTVYSQDDVLLSWTETDVWDPELTELFWSQIPTDTYLEGVDGEFPTNHATEADCEEADCSLEVSSTSLSSTPIRAITTDAGPEDFDGLSDAQQGLF